MKKPFGLATGRTMVPIYRTLVKRLKNWPTAEFEKLRSSWLSFNLDEYVGLSETDLCSFKAYMSEHLVQPLGLNPSQVNIPNGRARNLKEESHSYTKRLSQCGGFSFVLLGLGINGHIGFNDPPCGPESSCRVVTLSGATRQQNAFSFGSSSNSVPKQALTLGISEILQADEIHLIVTGIEKADVLDLLLKSSCSRSLPASWLLKHQRVFLWVDQDALSLGLGVEE